MNVMRRWLCALRRHDVSFSVGREQLRLVCPSCGYHSPGLDVAPARRIVRSWRFQRRVLSEVQ